MPQIVVMYKTPKDKAAFDKHYFGTHIPLAKKIPGLTKYEVSHGPVATPEGPSDIHLVAILHFETMAAMQNLSSTPEGKAASADVQNLGSNGAQIIIFDGRQV